MDEKENIIKYYSKTGESLTNLTGFSFDTRVGATANAFVLLKFSIKEPLQQQLMHQKINYYSTLIRVTSLSCEKVHRTFSTKIKQRFLRNAAYFDTRVGATANAFVLLKFSIKELLQQQLLHQKTNYYSTLIRVTSLSCEKVHRTFSAKIKQRFLRNAAYFGHSCWRNRQRFCLIKVFD